MFTIHTYLDKSEINGLGCFAGESIKKGEIIWHFQENFDLRLSQEQFEMLPLLAQEYFKHFAYYNTTEGGWILCGDDARYTNHSITPNMVMINDTSSIATRDINKGEEITEDYFRFDENAKDKLP